MLTQNKRLLGILITAGVIISLPAIAMLFTSEVNWTLSDFLVAAVLLFGTGLTCEFVLRRVKKTSSRLLIVGVILLALFLVWAELAVGIFGTPFAGS